LTCIDQVFDHNSQFTCPTTYGDERSNQLFIDYQVILISWLINKPEKIRDIRKFQETATIATKQAEPSLICLNCQF
jgi:hypothetical protein